MSDWKQPIYDEVQRNRQRRTEITTELNLLLTETSNGYSDGRLNVGANLIDQEQLVWDISIGHKKFAITEAEVLNWQLNETPGEEITTKEALKHILVYKMTL